MTDTAQPEQPSQVPHPDKFQYQKVRILKEGEPITPDAGVEVEAGEPWDATEPGDKLAGQIGRLRDQMPPPQ